MDRFRMASKTQPAVTICVPAVSQEGHNRGPPGTLSVGARLCQSHAHPGTRFCLSGAASDGKVEAGMDNIAGCGGVPLE